MLNTKNKMIDTKPHDQGKCTDSTVCFDQQGFRRSNIGKFKVKYQNGVSHCYFCNGDLKARMYMEGMRTKHVSI